ncbi:hypothetical protein FSP39_007967 [Pinctada imbricata]|uniref:carbonic anhydrase n=1 Tax=Pinctada imbricata TaxID=66713 RepID=A0AA88XMX1_PINIB|nr:hypothetical protein FSP39_007967 [Pinctada imbricata]
MELDVNLKPMKISGLERTKNYRLELFNNGHSAQVNVDGDVYVEGGGLPNRFQTAQFHFHWGRDDNTGSEHLYSGGSFPLELHVVNYNVKYGNSSNAMTKVGDGLAVLGFWFERSDSDNPVLTPLIKKLSSVQNADPSTKVPVSDLDLGKVISGNLDRFYRYSGSLTTPPCYESVIWSVFQTKIPISSSQLTAFRRLKKVPHGGKTTALVDNYRPPKTINGRKISISFPSGVATVSARPANWAANVNSQCGGSSQSPIDIPALSSTTYDSSLGLFTLSSFGDTSAYSLDLSNNGHTVTATVSTSGGSNLDVTGGGLPATYRAAQFHFHWGASASVGSEHTKQGTSYPAELHIVCWNTNMDNLSYALTQPEGLAVLGFFMEVHDTYTLSTFDIQSLVPPDISKYYRYPGSLTTPGCDESVIWTVFQSTITVSTAQMNKFRGMKSDTGGSTPLVNNYRPVQSLGSRIVKQNFSGQSVNHASIILTLVCAAVYQYIIR